MLQQRHLLVLLQGLALWPLTTGAAAATAKDYASMMAQVPIPEHVVDPPEIGGMRADRFPSKQDRLKIYMSNWYIPPCADYTRGRVHYNTSLSQQDAWPVVTARITADFAARQTNNNNNSTTATNWTAMLGKTKTLAPATTLVLTTAVVPDTAFLLDAGTILDCLQPETDNQYKDRIQFRKNMHMYCHDVASTVLTAVRHVQQETDRGSSRTDVADHNNNNNNNTFVPPTILQFGDLKHSHIYGTVNIPILKKFRSAPVQPVLEQYSDDSADNNPNNCLSQPRPVLATVHHTDYYQPIIWKLASHRHFGNLESVYREDIPWELKRNMAVFRGQLTGSRNDGFNKHEPPVVNCLKLRRCRLVYNHANSTLIHARLTSTRDRLPDVINGIPLIAPAVTLRRLLAYKGIIMLEGNDVASGLKWALLSQSVVLMPVPKHTSWAMEELLEPWVHYIPLLDNATDVEEKMQWVVDHDDVAQRIAERSSLWMEDLVYHPDAAQDDRWIQEEIIRRYRMHFIRDE